MLRDKKDVPRIEKLKKLVTKVNTIAKTNASGMFFLKISVNFSPIFESIQLNLNKNKYT